MTLGFFTRKPFADLYERSTIESTDFSKKNPKQVRAEKDGKVPYEYLVLSVLEDDAYVHKHGGEKYGKRNWTIDEINATTYVGAMFRHYKAWAEGEDLDPDSGKPHLTHLRACCAVVMDADKHGKLIDDRLFAEAKSPDGLSDAMREYVEKQRPERVSWPVSKAPTPNCGAGFPFGDGYGLFPDDCPCDACIKRRQ